MFTNWLTGTTTSAALNNSVNSENMATVITTPATNGGIMSTPPDVVLEVGPAPSVRFVAHSIVLGMHSGYLRSAIRLDENAAAIAGHSAGDLVLYLGNVTAEQFAPLLTYMYTGYLDLNVENIFGVLLATHVLHMPRALEICRSFLARAQTEGYLANGLATSLPPTSTAIATSKIIRPIPSKATMPNFGFLPTPAAPMSHQLPLPTVASVATNSFKSLQQTYISTPMIVDETRPQQPADQREEIVDVDRNSTKNEDGSGICDDDDDEDEEVFIDSNTDSDNEVETEIDCTISVSSRTSTLMKASKPQSIETAIIEREIVLTAKEKSKAEKREQQQKERSSRSSKSSTQKREKNEKRKSSARHHHSKSAAGAGAAAASVSGLQVAKAPIPASQLDASEGTKFIIDVASCDGPVRFRRILNTAYGHKPEDFAAVPERTQQSVSLSFHQQMAKTISQQRQQLAHAEESENSESSGGGGGAGGGGGGGSSGKHSSKASSSNEIYVCVYCKHTFKSQYCYQKHAKRHLNPLSLNCTSTSGAAVVAAEVSACEKLTTEAATRKGAYNANGFLRSAHTLPLPIVTSKQNASELLRREVRPLDMNVQYYPCKTCGSKFPSYYFVHKHRKMCHADEEAAESTGGGTAGASGSASGVAAATEVGLNSEEATSSAGGTVKKLD